MHTDIYNILKNIKEGKVERTEIKTLFRLMNNIAKEYFRRSNKTFIFNSILLPEDAAIETVTPLFTSRGETPFDKICTAFDKWKPEIVNEKDALFFIHQLIFVRCEHYLINALKKNSPEITAFINYLNIRVKEEGYDKQNYCGTTFIIANEKIIPGSRLISAEDFNRISSKIFFKRKLLLGNLFCYLKQENFFPAIPFYMIIERIKCLNPPVLSNEIYDESLSQNILIEEAAEIGLRTAVKKLKESYSEKNKLDIFETAAFKETLNDIRLDLIDGGITGGYFEYLHKYMPGIDQPEFKRRYENILEYLVKILKQATIKSLKQTD